MSLFTLSRFEATVWCDQRGTPYLLDTSSALVVRAYAAQGGGDGCMGREGVCSSYRPSYALIYAEGGRIEGIYCHACKGRRLTELLAEIGVQEASR